MSNATLQTLPGVAGFLALVSLAVFLIFWDRRRCRELMAGWAAENGYRLITTEERYLRRGPYFWTTSRGQSVFLVTLETADGQTRTAWLRVGHWLIGTLSRTVAVKWAD